MQILFLFKGISRSIPPVTYQFFFYNDTCSNWNLYLNSKQGGNKLNLLKPKLNPPNNFFFAGFSNFVAVCSLITDMKYMYVITVQGYRICEATYCLRSSVPWLRSGKMYGTYNLCRKFQLHRTSDVPRMAV
jgi:hypothetical protein